MGLIINHNLVNDETGKQLEKLHQRQKIRHIIDGLALETVLENLTRMLVFVVEILRIGNGDTLNRWY